MAKTYPLEIEQLHGDDEAFLMSRGHHDPKAFRAQAVIDWGLRTDPSEAGEDIETPKHGYMRIVPRDGYSNWHEPAKGPGPGAFPVTTASIYWERAALAAAPQPPDAFQTEGGLKSEIRTTSTAPVQMPEPAGCVVYANGESHHWDANRECAELFASNERARGAPYIFTFENLYTEQQVRELLAAKVKQGG